MSEVKYSEDHEWVRVEGDVGTVGITNFAKEQLGDVVYVEVPEAGTKVEKGGEVAVVESVKAASELYAPIDGEVTESNEGLADDPAPVNDDPEGEGWFFKIKITDSGQLDDLMDEAAYKSFVESQS